MKAHLAHYLQCKTSRITKRKMKLLLVLFIVLFGGASIAVIICSFTIIHTHPSIPSITMPKYALTPAPKLKIMDSLITYHEYARINQFKHYLEQLQQDMIGSKIYDSLLRARPHLLDSIHQVDSIYLHQ